SSIGTASADPLRIAPGASGNLVIEGENKYSYAGSKDGASSAFGDTLSLALNGQLFSADQWYQAILAQDPNLDPNSYTFVSISSAPNDVQTFMISEINDFFSQHPDQFQIFTDDKGHVQGVSTTLTLAAQFMSDAVLANFADFKNDYKPPKPPVITK